MLKKSLYLSLIASFSPLFLLSNGVAISSPLVSSPQLLTQTPKTPQQIAQNITVRVYTGDTNGSGVLIGKNGQTYTVITNAHVVKRGEPYRIQTPDGVTHNATLKTAEDALTGNDLALLQFNSTNNYSLAILAPTDPLKPNQPVYAAGFPYDSPQISISEGNVTLITPKPITGGYQIGFTNQTQQGMSGGVLLNKEGQLVGILGKGNAILTDAYNYQDGTTPDATILKQMQQSHFAIPIEPVAFLTKLYTEENTDTQIPRQVNQIAEKITVRIDTPSFDGSGVIIGRNGQTYYVLTASHVVQGLTDFKIITPDGKSHVVNKNGIKTFEGVDIGVVEFTSPETYQVAILADYTLGGFKHNLSKGNVKLDFQKPLIFLSGFPLVSSGNSSRKFTVGVASLQYENLLATQDRYSLSTGMELVYNALSLPGMSGGAVFDHQGRVIGINAGAEHQEISQGEESEEVLYFGNSLGVPIKTFLGQLQKGNLNPQWFKIETKAPETLSQEQIKQIRLGLFTQKSPTASSSAVEWFNYGKFLSRLEQDAQAIAAYDQAIQKNPQFYQAYYLKGLALKGREKYPEALAALEKVIEINPKFYLAWFQKAIILRAGFQQYSDALTALDKALQLQPQEAKLYGYRGIILDDLERDPEEEEAYTEAIKLKPNAQSYINRGSARDDWGDYEGAIADATKVIELQPNLSSGYATRANIYWQKIDISAALKDINTAIQLDPDNLYSYVIRSIILSQINDHQGAIADLTKIINNGREVPRDLLRQSYLTRATSYVDLKEWNKAIADFTKVIELDPNNAENYFVRGLNRHVEGKDLQEALADLTKAIALKPDYALAYHIRAEVYANQLKDAEKAKLDYKKAEELYTQNIEKVPNDPVNYSSRGAARRSLGNTQGAEEDFKKVKEMLAQDKSVAIEGFETTQKFRAKQKRMLDYYTQEISKNSNNFKLYFYRGIINHDLRDYQASLADFNRSVELNSNHPDAYYRRGLTYKLLKEYQKAIDDFTQALNLNIFEDTNVYNQRGSVYADLKNYPKAIEDFTQVINRRPNSLFPYLNRGTSYGDNEQYELAIKDFSKIIALFPDTLAGYYLRSLSYFSSENYLAALQDINKAISLDPNQANFYFLRGVISHKQGKNDQALEDYKLAVEKDKNLASAIINIGAITYEKGDTETALKQWQKALEINPNLAEPQLAIGAVLYSKGDTAKGLELAKKALTSNKNLANIDYLKKNIWPDKLIIEVKKLLQNPEMVTFLKK